MKKEIIEWLSLIEELDGIPPDDVIAFNFGLLQSDQGYMIYLVGSFEYSEENDDWACIEPPKKPYRYLKFPKKKQSDSWESILEYSKMILTDLESENAFSKTFLKNAKAITTGFDDGELIKIR